MKHLKSFNEDIDNEYWKEITFADIKPFENTYKRLNFNDIEYETLKSSINVNFKNGQETKIGDIRNYSNTIGLYSKTSTSLGHKPLLYIINKFEDEWYIIEPKFPGRRYYKCDQFDSVIKFLKEDYVKISDIL